MPEIMLMYLKYSLSLPLSYSSDLPAPSTNCAGRTSPAVAESATSPTDHSDQHINQYHESDSATSISTGIYTYIYIL